MLGEFRAMFAVTKLEKNTGDPLTLLLEKSLPLVADPSSRWVKGREQVASLSQSWCIETNNLNAFQLN